MSSLWPSSVRGHPGHAAGGVASEASLAALVYRSRAARPMSDGELDLLLQTAQERNRWESVTGVLLYDQGRFFQWLEGPAAGLTRIWNSIRNDPRHTDVEVVCHLPAQQRRFADWDMKLARSRQPLAAAPGDDAVVPGGLIEQLYHRPEDAPGILAALASRPATPDAAASLERKPTRSIVLDIVEAVALPHLLSEGALLHAGLPAAHPRSAELVGLLMAADPSAAFDLIDALRASASSPAMLVAGVVEPAARGLGDLWSADDCTDHDLTIGLSRLQTAVRRIGTSVPELPPAHLPVRAVLVATQPGELHRLGSVLDAEALWQAGWDTHCEYPTSDEALQDRLAETWFDALDLSLSVAIRREHWLPRITETVARARRASRNPALVVVVGGRVFVEHGAASLRVGADAASASSMQIGPLLIGALPTRQQLV